MVEKAIIYLNEFELDKVIRVCFKNNVNICVENSNSEDYKFIIKVTETQLSKIMYFITDKKRHKNLLNKFQEAGKNVFKW